MRYEWSLELGPSYFRVEWTEYMIVAVDLLLGRCLSNLLGRVVSNFRARRVPETFSVVAGGA